MSWSGGQGTSLIWSQGERRLHILEGDRRLHILDTESRGQGAAPPIYVPGTNNKYRKRYKNVLVWGVVDRGAEYHGKEVNIKKSLGSNRNLQCTSNLPHPIPHHPNPPKKERKNTDTWTKEKMPNPKTFRHHLPFFQDHISNFFIPLPWQPALNLG